MMLSNAEESQDNWRGIMENNRALAAQNAFVSFELLPIEKDEIDTKQYSKLPISQLSALGTAFDPIASAVQSVFSESGKSGVYWVNTQGKQMFTKSTGEGFIGSLQAANGGVGGGQAIMTPLDLNLNPGMLFMAMALYTIENKLDTIAETTKEILAFLELKEKAELQGDLKYLTEVLNDFKYNWNNEKFKDAKYIKVLDIKQDSERKIAFYQKQIEGKIKRKSFLHGNKDVKARIKKIDSDFEGYQLAVYLLAFSSFLEVMLLENFDSMYLSGISEKVNNQHLSYMELYTECYNQIEKYSQSSVESNLIKGASVISNVAGKTLEKIPVVKNLPFDEAFIKSSDKLSEFNAELSSRTIVKLTKRKDASILQFIDNIDTVNKLYNEPLEMLIDSESIYFTTPGRQIVSASET